MSKRAHKKKVQIQELEPAQRDADLISTYLTFFVANVSPKWINEGPQFSLDQPWPYEFPNTDTSYGVTQ